MRVFKEAADTNAPPVPTLQTNVLAVPEFTETPEEINSEIKISESMTLRAAKKADVPIKDLLNYLRLHPRLLAAPTGPGSTRSWRGGWRRRGRAWWWC